VHADAAVEKQGRRTSKEEGFFCALGSYRDGAGIKIEGGGCGRELFLLTNVSNGPVCTRSVTCSLGRSEDKLDGKRRVLAYISTGLSAALGRAAKYKLGNVHS
jgi:hypothetical protein